MCPSSRVKLDPTRLLCASAISCIRLWSKYPTSEVTVDHKVHTGRCAGGLGTATAESSHRGPSLVPVSRTSSITNRASLPFCSSWCRMRLRALHRHTAATQSRRTHVSSLVAPSSAKDTLQSWACAASRLQGEVISPCHQCQGMLEDKAHAFNAAVQPTDGVTGGSSAMLLRYTCLCQPLTCS